MKSHWKNMHEKKDGLPGQRFHATYPIVRDAQGYGLSSLAVGYSQAQNESLGELGLGHIAND